MKDYYVDLRQLLLCCLGVLFTLSAYAQSTVSGKVTQDGEALPGVNVIVKGTGTGTITDINGNYSLEVAPDGTLVFSYIGFETQEISPGSQTVVDVSMVVDVESLEEIVVTGYGSQKRKDLVGSIASVPLTEIKQRPISQIDRGLSGLNPGVYVADRNSRPGELTQVSIRAIGSLSAGYEPLWVIDGFPTQDQRQAAAINPQDIESVEILKDASATAIYGSRGANGVIIITTKSPEIGGSNLNFDARFGVATAPKSHRMPVMNSQQYVQYYTEANGGVEPDWITDYWDRSTDTDWMDEILQSGAYQNYSLSANGGGKKVSYLISANYTNEEGVVPDDGLKKYSSRVKVDYRASDRVTFGVTVAPNYSVIGRATPDTDDGGDQGAWYAMATLLPPILPIKRPDGSYTVGSDISGVGNIANPFEIFDVWNQTEEIFRMLGGVSLDVELIEGLVLRSTVTTNIGSDKLERTYEAPPGPTRSTFPSTSQLNVGQSQEIGWLNENTLNFKRQVDDHFFDAVIGFTAQKESFESLNSQVQNLQVPGIKVLSIGDQTTLTSRNALTANSLVSLLGRLNYTFKEKYLVTGTVRRDGSSRFGANNRWNTFGSVALGWRFSEESFMQSAGWLDNGKLRASYGSTGSNAIPDFIARSSLNPINHSFGNNQLIGTAIGDPGNPNLTWETSQQLDIGLDLSFLNSRFSVIFDYYNNKTTDLLLSKNVVPSSGFTGFLTNIGSMRNKGFEIAVNGIVVQNEDMEWSIGGNVTKNDQEILDLGGEADIRNFFGTLRRVVGGELQMIHVTQQTGILREGDTAPAQPNAQPGDMVYLDLNGDGQISNFLGPDGLTTDEGVNVDWIFGINSKFRYKNFSLSALVHGQAGASVLDVLQIQIATTLFRNNMSTEFWYDNRYIDENQPGNGIVPKAGRFNADGIGSVSSLGIQKTDYLRFKNITLAYTLPTSAIESIGLSNAFVYASVENLMTWSKFIGANPEGRRLSGGGPSLFGGSRIPGVSDERELGFAVSQAALPMPRTWNLGVNFTF